MTPHAVVLLIMDMESAKADVNGPEKKVHFWRILITNLQKHQKLFLKHTDPTLIKLNMSFKKI